MMHPEGFGELMLLPQAVKLYRNRYLHALRHSFFSVLPFLLAVSVLDILDKNVISPSGPFMASDGLNMGFWLTGGLTGEAYKQHYLIELFERFQIVVKLGYGTVSVIIAAQFAGRLADLWNVSKEMTIVTAVITYFMLSPLTSDESGLVWVFLNNRSFFTAFFSAFVSAGLLAYFLRVKNLKSPKLDYLPDVLAERMTYFLPVMLTLTVTVFLMLALIFLRPYLDTVLTAAMGHAFAQSPFVALLYQLFVWGLWWLGIPGYNFTAVIHDTIFPTTLFGSYAGNAATTIFTDSFFTAGIVHILGLIIAILIFSRHRSWRKAALLGLPFMIFDVEELFVFGLPVILNPIFLIPFLFAPLANTMVGWAAIAWGIVPTFQIFVPPTIPVVVNGIWATHSIMGGVLQIVWIIMDIFIYAPFVITANMFMLSDEAKEAEGGDED